MIAYSAAMVFAMALANILGLYLLAPKVKDELEGYWRRVAARR